MQNITENNKLIAEFMAGEKDKQVYIKHLNAWYDNCMGYKYNTDWNWLMEVVEKIESLGFEFTIKRSWAKITRKNENIVARWEDDKTKIESVYNACLEFIKWYNEQK